MTEPGKNGGGDIESLGDLLKRVRRAGNGHDEVSVADIVERVGDNAFPALLLVPALFTISPASAIPLFSSSMGAIMALISIQMIIGVRRLWLPAFLNNRKIGRDRFEKSIDFLHRPAAFVDRWTKKRLTFLTAWPLRVIPAFICLAAACVIPFFELIPMSSTTIAAAIAVLAVALMTRDGVLVFVGSAILVGAAWLVWTLAT